MTFRGIDPATNDWQFGLGLSNYQTAEKAIETNIATALRCFYGDAFWNTAFGVDWINLLGTKNTQASIILQTRALLASCFGVVSINSVSVNLTGRTMTLEYNINTIYSTSVVNSVNVLS